ncbi:LamG domain-containing protein [Delftia acidovorans]|uniref:LamG domain-containing protein n=1 Tax=Delftia acidovorans TaxID=80866 RepID=UPI001E3FFE04|nr:LamG domain-containing protein [Delftia acidovorans]
MALPQDNLPLNTTAAWNFDSTLVGIDRAKRVLTPAAAGTTPNYSASGPFAASCVTFNPSAGGYTGPLRLLGAGVGVFTASEDFCIEIWVKPTNGGHGDTYSRLVETKAIGALGGWNIVCVETASPAPIRFHRSDGSAIVETPNPVPNGAWTYLRIYRKSGQMFLQVGATVVVGPVANTDAFAAADLAVGANLSGSERYLGAIGGLRITRGASRASEPVPTAAFPPAYEVGTAALVAPAAVVDGFGFIEQRGEGRLHQPLVAISARGAGVAVLEQPSGVVTASGGPAVQQGAALAQPQPILAGQGAGRAAQQQPMPVISASGTTVGAAHAQLRQPRSVVQGGGATGATGRGVLAQPQAVLDARGAGLGHLVAAQAAVHGSGTTGAVGQAALRQPVPAISASGHGWAMGHGALVQPRARLVPAVIVALAQPMPVVSGCGAPLVDTAAAREVWCFTPTVDDEGRMGGALTRWPDYRGHAMARFAGSTWVTSPEVTYRMGGSDDAGAAVNWDWDTALTDFDAPQKKTMVSAYIGGVVPLHSRYRVTAGDSHKMDYQHDEYELALRNHRQKFGRGRKARYLGFGLSGAGPLAVDEVEFEVVAMTRRI